MGLRTFKKEWKARHSILVILGALLCLIAMWTQAQGQSSLPFVFTPPGVEFAMQSICVDGDCKRIEWERQESGGAWSVWATTESESGTHIVNDTLVDKTAARYRCKAFKVGWVCDIDGCREDGERQYGEVGPASDWVIGFIPGPPPGGCAKPEKQ